MADDVAGTIESMGAMDEDVTTRVAPSLTHYLPQGVVDRGRGGGFSSALHWNFDVLHSLILPGFRVVVPLALAEVNDALDVDVGWRFRVGKGECYVVGFFMLFLHSLPLLEFWFVLSYLFVSHGV